MDDSTIGTFWNLNSHSLKKSSKESLLAKIFDLNILAILCTYGKSIYRSRSESCNNQNVTLQVNSENALRPIQNLYV